MNSDEALTRWIYAEDPVLPIWVQELIGGIALWTIIGVCWWLI